MGGEIFAKTAKTPPLQSGVGGDAIAAGRAFGVAQRGHLTAMRC